jgi:hypothetical protein
MRTQRLKTGAYKSKELATRPARRVFRPTAPRAEHDRSLRLTPMGCCRIRFIGLTARGACLACEAVASRAHRDAETAFRQGSIGEVCLFTHSRAQLKAACPDRQPAHHGLADLCLTANRQIQPQRSYGSYSCLFAACRAVGLA